jgi:hypothetical protein
VSFALGLQVVAAREAIFAQVTAWLEVPSGAPLPHPDCGWAAAGVSVNVVMALINAAAAVIMGALACRRRSSGADERAPAEGHADAEPTGEPDGEAPPQSHHAGSQEGLHAPLLQAS